MASLVHEPERDQFGWHFCPLEKLEHSEAFCLGDVRGHGLVKKRDLELEVKGSDPMNNYFQVSANDLETEPAKVYGMGLPPSHAIFEAAEVAGITLG